MTVSVVIENGPNNISKGSTRGLIKGIEGGAMEMSRLSSRNSTFSQEK